MRMCCGFGSACLLSFAAQPGGAHQSLQCTMEVQALMAKAKSRRGGGGTGSAWTTVWQCQVLFSDDAARIRELQVRC